MKKFSKTLITCIAFALPMGLSAKGELSEVKVGEEFARCEIDVPGFYAKGRCGKVLQRYREFLSIQRADCDCDEDASSGG